MVRSVAARISLAVICIGSFAWSTQSVEAKTSRNGSHRARNYFVPPPPPFTPSIVPSALGMTYAEAVTYAQAVNADEHSSYDAVAEKSVSPHNKYSFTRIQGDMAQVLQPISSVSYNPGAHYTGASYKGVTYNLGVETKIQKHIESFDSEISSIEKDIGKLLNLDEKKAKDAELYAFNLIK